MSEIEIDDWVERKIREGYSPVWCPKCGKLLALIPLVGDPMTFECEHYHWVVVGNVSFDPRKCVYAIHRGTSVYCLVRG